MRNSIRIVCLYCLKNSCFQKSIIFSSFHLSPQIKLILSYEGQLVNHSFSLLPIQNTHAVTQKHDKNKKFFLFSYTPDGHIIFSYCSKCHNFLCFCRFVMLAEENAAIDHIPNDKFCKITVICFRPGTLNIT